MQSNARRNHKARARLPAAIAISVVVVMAGGCGGSTSDSSNEPLPKQRSLATSSSSTSTTLNPTAKVEAEVRLAYDEWRASVRQLFVDPDPGDPAVDDLYVDGPLKDAVLENLAKSRDAGRTAKLEDDSTTKWLVVKAEVKSATEVVLEDCYVNGGLTVSSSSGEVLDDSVTTFQSRLVFELGGGRWRLQTGEELIEEPGVGECASES